MALNVKQKYPGTQGGAAQLHSQFWRSSRNCTRLLTLACHSEEESKYLRACQNHTKKTWIFQAPEAPAPAAPAMKKLLFCWMRKDADAGSVDATWRISSLSLRMCARQDCFVFERPQVVFYCNFSSSRHVSKSTNLIGRIVFDAARQTQKTNLRRLKKKWRFYAWRFLCRCAHSHWRPLFSHEALNVGEYRAWNSSRCARDFNSAKCCGFNSQGTHILTKDKCID